MNYGDERDIGVGSSGKIAAGIVVAILIVLALVFHQDIQNVFSAPAQQSDSG